MARKHRVHLAQDDSPSPTTLKPKHLTKQEFGRRLYNLILQRGWSQSDTAREAGLERDKVSVYVRGKSLPTPTNLEKLSKAFGVKPEELLPNYVESAIDEDAPAFEMKVSTADTGVAWLRVNRMVKTSTAVKIAELLEADDVLNRSRSGDAASLQQK